MIGVGVRFSVVTEIAFVFVVAIILHPHESACFAVCFVVDCVVAVIAHVVANAVFVSVFVSMIVMVSVAAATFFGNVFNIIAL